MKIIKLAVDRVYRFNCPECGSKLEASPSEFEDLGGKVSRFLCPVCKTGRYISWRELTRRTVYTDGSNK